MQRFAIMQGRLLPPQNGLFQSFPNELWREEIPLAAEAGLKAIEWIYDLQSVGFNPIEIDAGIEEMLKLASRHKIEIVSLCADYFMDRPLVTSDPGTFEHLLNHLIWLLCRCQKVGITRVVLPFVDNSRINDSESKALAIKAIEKVLPVAEARGVELHLETSLRPVAFAALLKYFQSPIVKVNYDSGNSSSLGYKASEEVSAYGGRIGSVHIKDRLLGGGTVPLGQGNADFTDVFDALLSIPYQGDYVLQVARSTPGKEVEWARHNLNFLEEQLEAARARARFNK